MVQHQRNWEKCGLGLRVVCALTLGLCLSAGVQARQDQPPPQNQPAQQDQQQQAQPDQPQQQDQAQPPAPAQPPVAPRRPTYAPQDADKPPYSNDRPGPRRALRAGAASGAECARTGPALPKRA